MRKIDNLSFEFNDIIHTDNNWTYFMARTQLKILDVEFFIIHTGYIVYIVYN